MSRRKRVIGLAVAGVVSAGLGSVGHSFAASLTDAVPKVDPCTLTPSLPICQPPATPEPAPAPPPPSEHPVVHHAPAPSHTGGGTKKTTPTAETKPSTGGATKPETEKKSTADVKPGRGKNGATRANGGAPTVDNPTFSF